MTIADLIHFCTAFLGLFPSTCSCIDGCTTLTVTAVFGFSCFPEPCPLNVKILIAHLSPSSSARLCSSCRDFAEWHRGCALHSAPHLLLYYYDCLALPRSLQPSPPSPVSPSIFIALKKDVIKHEEAVKEMEKKGILLKDEKEKEEEEEE